MCNFNTIIQNNEGHIAQCAYCHTIEILYGTSLIHFEYVHMPHFIQYLDDVRKDYNAKERALKHIVLDLTMNNVLQVVLNRNSLQNLYNMLEQADTEIKQNNLLKLFHTTHK